MREQTNAANPREIKSAHDLERRKRESELNDVRQVIGTIEGRRLMWRIFELVGLFESIWDNSARIHYKAGAQDVGHWLVREITSADPDAFARLMKESVKGELNNE